jgi:hypothetical protein
VLSLQERVVFNIFHINSDCFIHIFSLMYLLILHGRPNQTEPSNIPPPKVKTNSMADVEIKMFLTHQ